MLHRLVAAALAPLLLGACATEIELLIFQDKNEQALEAIRATSEPPAYDPEYVKALYMASFKGEDEIVRALLERGAYVAGMNPYGTTPLMGALHDNTTTIHRSTVLLLLEHGADVNQRSSTLGITPLHFACRRQAKPSEQADKLAIVKLLIERGADPLARTEGGHTTLDFAVYDGGLEVPRELIARGVDPSTTDDIGGSPLLEAAVRGHDDAARLLLEHGARPRVMLEQQDPKDGPYVVYNEFLASGRAYLVFAKWSEARGNEADARETLPIARAQLAIAVAEYQRSEKLYSEALEEARSKRNNRYAASALGTAIGIAAVAVTGVGFVVTPPAENTVERLEETLEDVKEHLARAEAALVEVDRRLAEGPAPAPPSPPSPGRSSP